MLKIFKHVLLFIINVMIQLLIAISVRDMVLLVFGLSQTLSLAVGLGFALASGFYIRFNHKLN